MACFVLLLRDGLASWQGDLIGHLVVQIRRELVHGKRQKWYLPHRPLDGERDVGVRECLCRSSPENVRLIVDPLRLRRWLAVRSYGAADQQVVVGFVRIVFSLGHEVGTLRDRDSLALSFVIGRPSLLGV